MISDKTYERTFIFFVLIYSTLDSLDPVRYGMAQSFSFIFTLSARKVQETTSVDKSIEAKYQVVIV